MATDELPTGISLDSLSLGGVAAVAPKAKLPKRYRTPQDGEKSTYQGAGVVPATRLEDGLARILLWQPQSGAKQGVRWYDFGGSKETRAEYTSICAARKFAKQTYGIFGCNIEVPADNASSHLRELYQGLCNLPLMMQTSREWAQLQLCNDNIRVFYNDIHEYHCYFLSVPHVEAEVLTEISKLVDGGKRVFRWFTADELKEEVVAPRLHTDTFSEHVAALNDDEEIRASQAYGDGGLRMNLGAFTGIDVGDDSQATS